LIKVATDFSEMFHIVAHYYEISTIIYKNRTKHEYKGYTPL